MPDEQGPIGLPVETNAAAARDRGRLRRDFVWGVPEAAAECVAALIRREAGAR